LEAARLEAYNPVWLAVQAAQEAALRAVAAEVAVLRAAEAAAASAAAAAARETELEMRCRTPSRRCSPPPLLAARAARRGRAR